MFFSLFSNLSVPVRRFNSVAIYKFIKLKRYIILIKFRLIRFDIFWLTIIEKSCILITFVDLRCSGSQKPYICPETLSYVYIVHIV